MYKRLVKGSYSKSSVVIVLNALTSVVLSFPWQVWTWI